MSGIKLENVDKELKLLKNLIQDKNLKIDIELINKLKEANKNLWKIEDRIRIKERNQEFDKELTSKAKTYIKSYSKIEDSIITVNDFLNKSKKIINSFEQIDKVNKIVKEKETKKLYKSKTTEIKKNLKKTKKTKTIKKKSKILRTLWVRRKKRN